MSVPVGAAAETIKILEGGLDDPRVGALLAVHLMHSRAATPAESAHALDLAALRAPDIRFWTAWSSETLLGCAALRRLSANDGELKSMHTSAPARRRGVGTRLLRTVIDTARADGLQRLSLETGSSAYFRPAVDLYAANGFVPCGPFGSYREDANSLYMTRVI